jgi:hypothetical protein
MLYLVRHSSTPTTPQSRLPDGRRRQLFTCSVAAAFTLLVASGAAAQDQSGTIGGASVLWEAAQRVALDPTTYAPTAIVYTSQRLDWASSQPLFRAGYVEANPRYTTSGLPFDLPVSYVEGHKTIARDTAALFAKSLANNAACSIVERVLINRAPKHRKLIRTLGWIERVSVASYWSYRLSVRHFEQWRANERIARQIGAR